MRANHVNRNSGVLGQINATVSDLVRSSPCIFCSTAATFLEPVCRSEKVHVLFFHWEPEVEGIANPTAC